MRAFFAAGEQPETRDSVRHRATYLTTVFIGSIEISGNDNFVFPPGAMVTRDSGDGKPPIFKLQKSSLSEDRLLQNQRQNDSDYDLKDLNLFFAPNRNAMPLMANPSIATVEPLSGTVEGGVKPAKSTWEPETICMVPAVLIN